MIICRICEKELIPEINWSQCHIKRHDHICSSCLYKEVEKWRKCNKNHVREYRRKYNWKTRHFFRNQILEFLGNECSNLHCPIPKDKLDKRTLQIDHVKGHGNKERASFSSPYQYYQIIYKRILDGSKDYQLLCPYCNTLKRIEKKESLQPID